MRSKLLKSMAAHLGAGEDELRKRIEVVDTAYSVFRIPKRRGYRRIEAPHPWLKTIQRFLLDHYLVHLPVHLASHAFCRERSIFSHACRHADLKWVVTVDIHKFFPSVKRSMLERLPHEFGLNQGDGELLLDLVTRKGHLPQGAPTSPHLGNLVLRDLDQHLETAALEHAWNYSRYADDLVISGDENPQAMLAELKRAVSSAGFRVNPAKCRIMGQHQRQWVTGLVVNRGMKLPRDQRRLLRAVEHRMRNGLFEGDSLALRGQIAFRDFALRQEQALLDKI